MQASIPLPRNLRIAASDLASDLDLTAEELRHLLELGVSLKRNPPRYAHALAGKYLSLLFEKPSLRTRLTFELAIKQLGGDAVASIGPIGDREPLKDVARNLDRWTHAIVARVFSQKTIEDLALWSNVPVINALSDMYHPCQALADALTMHERFGSLRGLKVAYVGDGNNVAHSLMLTTVRLGADFSISTPHGYEPDPGVVRQTATFAEVSGGSYRHSYGPEEAAAGVDVVYTDVWTSMGYEAEGGERRKAFRNHQVNEELFRQAAPGAVFMHCLPAHRGEEVTEGVIEAPGSVVFDQAENRLHAQKALLLMLLE